MAKQIREKKKRAWQIESIPSNWGNEIIKTIENERFAINFESMYNDL